MDILWNYTIHIKKKIYGFKDMMFDITTML